MITDTNEIAERLRTEADYWRDYNEDDTLFNWWHYDFVESVLTAFDIDDMDMPVYELFDKLADIINPQSS
jgi:hypothetical protein